MRDKRREMTHSDSLHLHLSPSIEASCLNLLHHLVAVKRIKILIL